MDTFIVHNGSGQNGSELNDSGQNSKITNQPFPPIIWFFHQSRLHINQSIFVYSWQKWNGLICV